MALATGSADMFTPIFPKGNAVRLANMTAKMLVNFTAHLAVFRQFGQQCLLPPEYLNVVHW